MTNSAARFSSGIDTMDSVFNFIRGQISHKKQIGKVRSSETYRSMLNSFTHFRKGVDLTFDMMDGALMELYEAWMRKCGLTRNSTSFYMRILRTNYKLAVEKRLTPDRHPFRNVYCGIDKTVKRSLPFSEIKRINGLDLVAKAKYGFREGHVHVQLLHARNVLHRYGLPEEDGPEQRLPDIPPQEDGTAHDDRMDKQMQDIIDKYKSNGTSYLLPIITREDGSERRQYQNQMRKINRILKDIANQAGLPLSLSMYYTRHSWATIARGRDVPLAVISEGLGHDSETTTQIYLDSIKSSEVDKVNRMILEGL